MKTALLLAALSAVPVSAQGNLMSAGEAEAGKTRGLHVSKPGAFEGYTLFAPLNAKRTYLIDMQGEVVHSWETDSSPGSEYLLDDGSLLRCGREDDDPRFSGGGIGGRLQRLAPDGTLIWNWRLADQERHQHHDIEPLPNGNLLLIFWERVPEEEAVSRGRDPEAVGPRGLWPDGLLEIRPIPPDDARIVWEWHSWDHIVQDRDIDLPGYDDVPLRPERIDVNGDHRNSPPLTAEERKAEEELRAGLAAIGYLAGDEPDQPAPPGGPPPRTGDMMHVNAVAYLAEYDLIVLSSPEFDELWVIDHSTTSAEAATSEGGRWGHGGDLLWRWGNPRTYGAGGDTDRKLFYQHDPTWIEGGNELRLLVFNNGRGRPGGDYSSVDELVLPFDKRRGFLREGREPFGPKEPDWSYSDPGDFYAPFISGAQRLPNGNTLICSGPAGRLFEVTPAGEIVWDFYNPYGGEIEPPAHAGHAPPLALFRGTRLAKDQPGIRKLLGEK
jgi:hypothetical protein